MLVVPATPAAATMPVKERAVENAPSQPHTREPRPPDPDRVLDPDVRLGPKWRESNDRAVITSGDETGLHVLVADRNKAYRWRTAATLAEPGLETDQWIGQLCLTGSGRRAVVVYAPRQFANREQLMDRGGFAAVVDLSTGTVTKLSERVTLAYYNPGCGAGETAVISRLETAAGNVATTWVGVVDTAQARQVMATRAPGQLTSVVPQRGRLLAAKGHALVEVTTAGVTRVVVRTGGTPYRIIPDNHDRLAFQVDHGATVDFVNLSGGTMSTVGSAATGAVKLHPGAAGRVNAVGGRASVRLAGRLPVGWQTVDAPPDSKISTTGDLVVAKTSTGRETPGPTSAAPYDGRADRVDIGARLRSGAALKFSTEPLAGPAGRRRSPALGGRVTTPQQPSTQAAPDHSTTPWDPDRACAVPRNDPAIQTYQPTPDQVEWAADLAVRGQLTFQRPANWLNYGLPAYAPQGLFPSKPLDGGGSVPAQIMLGILAQESNLWQATFHVVDGSGGNPLTSSGFYGIEASANPDPRMIDWSRVDCGYGAAQVTTGMRVADTGQTINGVVMDYTKQKTVALDYATNIVAGLRLLQDKWNQTRARGLIANDGNPQYIENWWFAIWAYNTGFYEPTPPNTPPGPWGVGWANNPSNPRFPADRQMFLTEPLDVPAEGVDDEIGYDNAKHPNHWSYPERVIGFAYTSLRRFDYSDGVWSSTYVRATANNMLEAQPGRFTFCVATINQCDPAAPPRQPGNFPGEPPGPCQRDDLKCWWHEAVTWTDCGNNCGRESRLYTSVEPRPYADNIYPAQCAVVGLPPGARIVDDISTAGPLGPEGCSQNWTNGGSFGLKFGAATGVQGQVVHPSKVDFHQINGGFGGHFWFAHTAVAPGNDPIKVTGTWTITPVNAWSRLFVHVPDHGSHTQQSDYKIYLPNQATAARHRAIPTRIEANKWVELGVYDFRGTTSARVELSNFTEDGVGVEDIAWDALAVQPLQAKPQHFVVAMGDSYISGDGMGGYYPETDNNYGNHGWNACRRSVDAWPRKVVIPGSNASVGQRVDTHDAGLAFQSVACSGAAAAQVSNANSPYYWLSPPSAIGDYHRAAEGQGREISQIQSGVLNNDTTLVLVSAGGNDAGFPDVMSDCAESDCVPNEQGYRQDIDGSQIDIRSLINSAHVRAPNATIVLAGYPMLFAGYHEDSCGYSRYSSSEMDLLNRLAEHMRDAQSRTVNEARSAGINAAFVDMVQGFQDHGTCRKYDIQHDVIVPEDINGVVVGPTGPGDFQIVDGDDQARCVGWIQVGVQLCISRASFHPKNTGSTLYGDAVSAKLVSIGYH